MTDQAGRLTYRCAAGRQWYRAANQSVASRDVGFVNLLAGKTQRGDGLRGRLPGEHLSVT